MFYLHSSMDRFEENKYLFSSNNSPNLHSSMDRFEVCCFLYSLSLWFIYIPVWIDLKQSEFSFLPILQCIYIPVWIDLKVIESWGFKYKTIFTFQYG